MNPFIKGFEDAACVKAEPLIPPIPVPVLELPPNGDGEADAAAPNADFAPKTLLPLGAPKALLDEPKALLDAPKGLVVAVVRFPKAEVDGTGVVEVDVDVDAAPKAGVDPKADAPNGDADPPNADTGANVEKEEEGHCCAVG